jgi:cyclopropane-fatty-acyl-phospholipid synthase
LDIGYGWGALACWAARHYGVKVHGITLSEEQFLFASERVYSEGLTDRVEIEVRDYRDLRGEALYDRVVSVGMFEHVGVKNFPIYFSTVRRVLKPDGLFLNHGITSETGWESSVLTTFINRYIFPDGELARFCDVMNAMESAGFEVVDVESLRRHYALTLRQWIKALEANRDAVINTSSNRIYRLWRLYMAGCAYHFEHGETNVYQLLAGCAHQASPLPLRRDDLYMLN